MRRAYLCFSMMGIVLAATCACVSEAPMTPSASQAPLTTPASAIVETQPPSKDVDPCLGQTRFEDQGDWGRPRCTDGYQHSSVVHYATSSNSRWRKHSARRRLLTG